MCRNSKSYKRHARFKFESCHSSREVVVGNDIIGDDVNIASRIEKYAASGGIAISGRVNASLERDPKFSTQYLGSPYLKGVSQEVKIYSIISHGLPALDPIIEKTSVENQKMKWNIFSLTGAVLSIIGVLFWINVSFLSKGTASSNKYHRSLSYHLKIKEILKKTFMLMVLALILFQILLG